ncbi:hypothetical protein OESDEN_06494 [Oesophagostomum dentatum]|uniref:Uncharacterized protein n=1 Tax=Oesophagostomum dentatum TaxID=61180 RepID=A0A0B1T7R7_OESDE|nr:hypothetical protein OESDEN_06494 [Oesophagostomum dentatum]
MNLVDELISNANDRTRILERYDPVKNLDCHDSVVRAFTSTCINWNKVTIKISNVQSTPEFNAFFKPIYYYTF